MTTRIFRYELGREGPFFTATCIKHKRLSVAVRNEALLMQAIHSKLERRFWGWAAFQIGNPWATKADAAFALIHKDELKSELNRYYATHGK